jgi:hypothetical protein
MGRSQGAAAAVPENQIIIVAAVGRRRRACRGLKKSASSSGRHLKRAADTEPFLAAVVSDPNVWVTTEICRPILFAEVFQFVANIA